MNKIWLILSLLLVTSAMANTGTALKADSLRAEPFSDAKTVGNISRDDKLEIMEKKGAWLKVKSAKASGWVRLLSVKRGEARKSGSNASVLALSGGRSGTGKVVSTTGVRGLNEEELKAAKFNEQEVSQLESYTISRDAAQQFATSGSLSARKLDYLPEPSSQGVTP